MAEPHYAELPLKLTFFLTPSCPPGSCREKKAEATRRGRRVDTDDSDSASDGVGDGGDDSGSEGGGPGDVADDPFFQQEADPFNDPFFQVRGRLLSLCF